MNIEKMNWFAQHVAQLHRIAEHNDANESLFMYSAVVEEYLIFFPGSVFNADFAKYLDAGGIYEKKEGE